MWLLIQEIFVALKYCIFNSTDDLSVLKELHKMFSLASMPGV